MIVTLKPSYAQAPSETTKVASENSSMIYGNVEPNVPKNLHTLSQSVLIETLSSFTCLLAGKDVINPKNLCLTVNPKTGKIAYATPSNGGLGKFFGQMIGSTATIPISSGDYAVYAASNFGITKHAYAAANTNYGIGFNRLQSLINVWTKFRDLAYLFFVLAFTVIGLAIIFRIKIDARTVMTIQNQIPKIVIALVLVTFSFTIAGLLIDLMYVLIYFIVITFSTITPAHVNVNASVFGVFNKVFAPNIHPIVGDIAGKANYGVVYDIGTSGIVGLSIKASSVIGGLLGSLTTDFLDSSIAGLFSSPFMILKGLDIGCDVFSSVGHWATFGLWGGASCDFAQTVFENTVTLIFSALAFLVVIIGIIYSLFRVWFTLIKSFIYVLVDAMIGPLWIAAGVFPGSKLGFTTWVRHLMGHLSVFPMTFAVILLGKTIMEAVGSGPAFSPPLIGDAIGSNANNLAAIVGFGFILSIPTILDRTRKAVGAMDFGLVDVKKSFSTGVAVPRSGISTAIQSKTKTASPGAAPGFWKTALSKV